MEIKILININYYYYLITIILITLFINKNRASYLNYFKLCRLPNRKYVLCFVKIAVNG
jgi:hypothetical protein